VSIPRVSVIVPVRDVAEYLDDALASLSRQFDDPLDLEVVLVDDGSDDGTPEIARAHAALLPGLVILENEEPVGAATARNQGLDVVRGRYVTYLDGDDWLVPGHLEAMADAIEFFGCPVLRHDHMTVEGATRRTVRAPEPVRDRVLDPRESILPEDRPTMVDYPYAWAGLYDRAIAADGLLTFTDGMQTATDRAWVWRLHLDGPQYVVVNARGVCYRRGVTTSLTQTYDMRRLDFTKAFAEIATMLENDREPDRFLPKLVRTVLAITAHHLGYVEHMPDAVRDELMRRSSQLISSFPDRLVAEALVASGPERQQVLRDVVPAGLVVERPADRGEVR